MDLDLVAGEVAQAGDNGGLLGMDGDHGLGAFKGFLILGDARTRARAWCGG